MRLSYSQVLKILSGLNEIAPESDGAFRARLRHFQRLGFPRGSNTGKGKSAEYDLEMLMQLTLAIEFMQAGITPSRIVELVNKNWTAARQNFLLSVMPKGTFVSGSDKEEVDPNIALCLSPESLRELTTHGEADHDYYEAFHFRSANSLFELFNDEDFHPLIGTYWRWVIILLRPMMFMLLSRLEAVTGVDTVQAVRELYDIIIEYEKKMAQIELSIDAEGETNGNP